MHKSIFKYTGALLLGLFLATSCEDYLDQSPEAAITENDVFSKFVTFQGYVDDIYAPAFASQYIGFDWLFPVSSSLVVQKTAPSTFALTVEAAVL